MWTTINGIDYTQYIAHNGSSVGSGIQFSQAANDPSPTCTFDVIDTHATLSLTPLSEVVLWNENASTQLTMSGNPIPVIPAHNSATLFNTVWAATSGESLSLFSAFPGLSPIWTCSNTSYTLNNISTISMQTPVGYVQPSQSYMLSVYVTIATPLVNAQAKIEMRFLDRAGNDLSASTSTVFSSTTGNITQRISIHAVAPANASSLLLKIGGQVLVSGSNSGSITFASPQCEAMFFPTRVVYPTPDCNFNQLDSVLMPDGTTSRLARFFTGFIDTIKVDYIGPVRVFHVTCAGPGKLLDDGFVNTSYAGFTDSAIITDVLNTFFAGKLSITAPNSRLPATLVTGVTVDSISYNDNSFKDVLNGISNLSNFIFYVDPYFQLYYEPQYYNSASFALSSSPDNIHTFPYYAYTYELDATQLKRDIIVNGGRFSGTRQDTFSGDGATKQFTLFFVPDFVHEVTIGGAWQQVGIFGRDSFSATIQVLVNQQDQYILFNTAPASGTNNIVVNYSYVATVASSIEYNPNPQNTPTYLIPSFSEKINDTTIVDLATATNRGLTEISLLGSPLKVINCTSQKYVNAGSTLYFTSTSDGIINKPFIVQSVTGTMLGMSEMWGVPVNEFTYTLGAYQPKWSDQLRNVYKAINRHNVTKNIDVFQQLDFVAFDSFDYFDTITAKAQTNYATNFYGLGEYGSGLYGSGLYGGGAFSYGGGTDGTGLYGSGSLNTGGTYGGTAYGGETGTYGTARYQVTYIYG